MKGDFSTSFIETTPDMKNHSGMLSQHVSDVVKDDLQLPSEFIKKHVSKMTGDDWEKKVDEYPVLYIDAILDFLDRFMPKVKKE